MVFKKKKKKERWWGGLDMFGKRNQHVSSSGILTCLHCLNHVFWLVALAMVLPHLQIEPLQVHCVLLGVEKRAADSLPPNTCSDHLQAEWKKKIREWGVRLYSFNNDVVQIESDVITLTIPCQIPVWLLCPRSPGDCGLLAQGSPDSWVVRRPHGKQGSHLLRGFKINKQPSIEIKSTVIRVSQFISINQKLCKMSLFWVFKSE